MEEDILFRRVDLAKVQRVIRERDAALSAADAASIARDMVQVYNRFGQMVFNSSGYTTPWDGNHQGAKLPQGTYYYKISVRSGKQVVSGVISIIY